MKSIKQLVIDFETVDHGIAEGVGPGWPFGGVMVIHCGVKEDDKPSRIVEDMDELKDLISRSEYLVAHNGQYEMGILHYLGVDVRNIKMYCTLLGAKLVDSNRIQYGLDALGNDYLGEAKLTGGFYKAAHDCHLIQIPEGYEDLAASDKASDRNKAAAFKTRWKNIIYNNLDVLDKYSDVVKEYCLQDVDITAKLFTIFSTKLDMAVYTKYTRLINVCTAIRAKGVRVDIRAAYEARNLIRSKLIDLEKELFSNYGYVNYQSPLQMRSWSATLGLDPYMKDGKRSYGKEFRDMHKGQPVIDLLEEAMKYSKCQSFTDIILNHERNGRVYPSLVIMQAKTGRFACTSPNIQQIPARDPILGPLLRGVFIPDEGESWYALDFSAQEPRLQIHYASKLELNSAIQLARKYIEDPNMDSHQAVCDMVNANSSEKITRKQAKTINLGLSYGMGKAKLAASLGVTEDEAVKLKNTYNKCAPFLDKLSKACQNAVKSRGCIKTIGGRSVVVDEGFEYKALNALIQGSAFDQIAEAMLQLYDRNIIPLMCVHDELDFSCDDQTARVAKEIMETCIPMEVPSVAELNKGNNWGECK